MYERWLRVFAIALLLGIISSFITWLISGKRRLQRAEARGEHDGLGRLLLIKGLGVLWLVAGLLQAQPDMFTSDFYAWYPRNVMPSLIQQTAEGQPAWLLHLMHTGSTLWALQPIVWNWAVIVLQVGLGVLLLWGKFGWQTFALKVSVGWALVVWIGGEGMGGIFSTGEGFFTGWPGSALLYAFASFIALRYDQLRATGFSFYLQRILGLWWVWFAWLELKPQSVFWKTTGLLAVFGNASTVRQPALLSSVIQSFALFAANHTFTVNWILGLIMLGIGLLHFLNTWPKWVLDVTIVWLLWSWWFGQDFGTLFAGLGTDLNTAPVMVLLTMTAWFVRQSLPHAQGLSAPKQREDVK